MKKDKTSQKLEEDIIQESQSSKEQYIIKQKLDFMLRLK